MVPWLYDFASRADRAMTSGEAGRNESFWNGIADTYSQGESGEAEAIAFLRAGGSYLFDVEREILGDLAPDCRRAIHLQCSGGNDALSLLRQGASEVVGVDISERLLAVATRKARALAAPARWVHADILTTPRELDATADLVYTGKGALCWMSDIDAWAVVVSRLLAPGGRFFVYEAHPLDWVWDISVAGYALDAEHGDYFSSKPRESLFARVTRSTPRYRNWTLAQIVNALIAAGLVIDRLEEYSEPFWDQFPSIPSETLHRLPHAFALLARKPKRERRLQR